LAKALAAIVVPAKPPIAAKIALRLEIMVKSSL
jgi:hypothetical protein